MFNENYWYYRKHHKSLHNIDTFYFSVKLGEDLTSASSDPKVKACRDFLKRFKEIELTSTNNLDKNRNEKQPVTGIPFKYLNLDHELLVVPGAFAMYYSFHLQCLGSYDLFFAPTVPSYNGGESVTSEIFVQIRSKLLWELGCKLSFDLCMKTVNAFCDFFGFTIVEVHEARTDFCWHTNGLQDPEHYLKIDNLTSMRVSQFHDVQQHYRYIGDDEYESDYVAHGRRGGKCFLRIYLKTKEVIEMGYKPWFLYIWLFNQMISRYDFYVLEKAFLMKRWKYCDIARLEFAKEFLPLTKMQLSEIEKLLNFDLNNRLKQPDYEAIKKLADSLTPKITKILNIEYQVSRRMSKSFKLFSFKANDGISKRVYDFLDNRKLITDYLTSDTFRLVDRNSNPRKTRCDYSDFWKRLRNTKQVDVPIPPDCLKLVREYNSQISVEIRKTRAIKGITSFGAVTNGNENIDIFEDAERLLTYLNDNDIEKASGFKRKAVALLPKDFQIEEDDLLCDEDGVVPD